MAILIDLIVVGTLLLSTYLGYKKGLIGVAFKILSFLIAIIITLILFKPISNYIINNTTISQTIENAIIEKLSAEQIEGGQLKQEESNLPSIVVEYINNGINETVNETKDNVIKIIARKFNTER